MDFQHVLQALPHGPEFRFVDRVLELNPGKSAKAELDLHEGQPFFAGHFPGRPLMPAVLMTEAIAQLGGVVAQCDPEYAVLDNLLLTAIRQVKVLGSAGPGATLVLEVEIVGRMDGLIQVAGKVSVVDQLLLHGQVVLSGDLRAADKEAK